MSIISSGLRQEASTMVEMLTKNPESWFDRPSGALMKPDFKRKEQKLGFVAEKSGNSFRIFSSFKKRYFILEDKVLKYYRSESVGEEAGQIILTSIVEIRESQISDAPENSFDLLSNDQAYTLAADTRNEMIRWVIAIQAALLDDDRTSRASSINPSLNSLNSMSTSFGTDSEWLTFTVTLPAEDKGPLDMFVKGIEVTKQLKNAKTRSQTYHWVVITGFDKRPDGGVGLAEGTGKLAKKDIIVGANGIDLTILSFQEAMDVIRGVVWPLVLDVAREKRGNAGNDVLVEGWIPHLCVSVVGEEDANSTKSMRLNRRYVEVTKNQGNSVNISLHLPTPGGAIQETPYRVLSDCCIESLSKLTAPAESSSKIQHCLTVNALFATSSSSGPNTAGSLKLYFKDVGSMRQWESALSELSKTPMSIESQINENVSSTNQCLLAIKNSGVILNFHKLPGKTTESQLPIKPSFLIRDVSLYANRIEWTHVIGTDSELRFLRWGAVDDDTAIVSPVKISSVDYTSSSTTTSASESKPSLIRRMSSIAIKMSSSNDDCKYPYAIMMYYMSDGERTSFALGFVDREVREQALNLLKRNCFDGVVPESETIDTRENGGDDDDKTNASSSAASSKRLNFFNVPDISASAMFSQGNKPMRIIDGYVFKQSTSDPGKFIRRYCVFSGTQVSFFKSNLDAFNFEHDENKTDENCKPVAVTDLSSCTLARLSVSLQVPLNSIELIGQEKEIVECIAIESDSQLETWLEDLTVMIEAKSRLATPSTASQPLVRRASVFFLKEPAKLAEEKIEAMRSGFLMTGYLVKRTGNRITNLTSWKKRYFILTRGCLSYYENENDVFNEDANVLGEISVHAIDAVRSEIDREAIGNPYQTNISCQFDVIAYVAEGETTADGKRIYSFQAESRNLCIDWMQRICYATKRLQMNTVQSDNENIEAWHSGKIEAEVQGQKDKQVTKPASRRASIENSSSSTFPEVKEEADAPMLSLSLNTTSSLSSSPSQSSTVSISPASTTAAFSFSASSSASVSSSPGRSPGRGGVGRGMGRGRGLATVVGGSVRTIKSSSSASSPGVSRSNSTAAADDLPPPPFEDDSDMPPPPPDA